ncbi:MAG TPA: nuclear transport factor 2 family protein [Homoserinimonas sp.]|nr:nuclear transport factor 2 family protein [Homoserinimonas sp.]
MEPDTVIREYAAAWGRGDPEAAFAFYGDDIVMHLPGRGSLAGTHRGRQAVIAAIKLLLARTDGLPVEVEVLDRLVSGEGVALVLREAATRGDELLELRRVNLYRVTDGKIRAIEIFEANQYEVDEFFG